MVGLTVKIYKIITNFNNVFIIIKMYYVLYSFLDSVFLENLKKNYELNFNHIADIYYVIVIK